MSVLPTFQRSLCVVFRCHASPYLRTVRARIASSPMPSTNRQSCFSTSSDSNPALSENKTPSQSHIPSAHEPRSQCTAETSSSFSKDTAVFSEREELTPMIPRQNGSVTESSTFPSHTSADVAGTSDSVPSQRTEHATEQSDSSTFQINPTRQPEPTSSVDSGTSSQKHIQLVPSRLHHHLFGDSSASTPELSQNESAAQDELFAKLELPKLYGQNLQEHFLELGMKQTAAYREQLDIAANMQTIPKMPTKWVLQVGWTKYEAVKAKNGFRTISEKVDYPDEKLLFFDVEVCMADGQLPTLAVALSPTAWYSWCSNRLVYNTTIPKLYRPDDMIPLESSDLSNDQKDAKIVIGHNVAYDRSRVREQYYREQTPTRFWDTMSMAIPIYGMADHQVLLYEKNDLDEDDRGHSGWVDEWKARVSKNSLLALHEKLCVNAHGNKNAKKSKLRVNKSMQSFFVHENIDEIRNNFQDLVRYCAEDVTACFELYQALYPEFTKRFPHPITWLGMLEMGAVYLPVTENWRKFYVNCERDASNQNQYAAHGVIRIAKELSENLLQSERFKEDPWLWGEDWKCRKSDLPTWYASLLKSKKLLSQPVQQLNASDIKLRSRVIPKLFGLCWGPYPLHFKADKGWGFLVPKAETDDAESVPAKSAAWLRRGEEVIIPNRAIYDVIANNLANGVGDVTLSEPSGSISVFDFYRLPHPKGGNANVGDPLAKDFHMEIEEGVLRATRYEEEFRALLVGKKTTRFWGNYSQGFTEQRAKHPHISDTTSINYVAQRDRFNEQVTVWFDDDGKEGAIAASVIPAGTITRRAVHKLWLTAINPKDNEMIGTGLKSMIECSEGWKLVGADVDSQEQWIAALLGDSAVGQHRAGVTPFSNMLLAGSKADHSDLHSVVAKEVGISRDKAKVLNYARLYGSGLNHAVEFLKQSGISAEQAQRIAEKLFQTTKGRSCGYYRLSSDMNAHFEYFLANQCPEKLRSHSLFLNGHYFLPDFRTQRGRLTALFEEWISKEVSERLREQGCVHFKKDVLIDQLYDGEKRSSQTLFSNGFESATFNYLELIVGEEQPRTPVLGCRLGYALEPLPKGVPDREYFLGKYKRSVVNWVVQSSAVDFLHMLLACMRWLCCEYDIQARFVISIHDEIRYLVKYEDRYRCALALALSNMYVRAAISQKLGIEELPLSVAFFSQVDIDQVLRKEVTLPCRTPDGNEIPPGEAVDMKAILEKTGGSLRKNRL